MKLQKVIIFSDSKLYFYSRLCVGKQNYISRILHGARYLLFSCKSASFDNKEVQPTFITNLMPRLK